MLTLWKKIKAWFSKGESGELICKPAMPEPKPQEPVHEGMDYEAIIAKIEIDLGDLSPSQENGIKIILKECAKQKASALEAAYLLATAWHETNKTMKPVIEAYWLSEEWRKKNLRYYPYYGRGYVQLTWKANYEKYGIENDPNKACEPEMAAYILVHGCKNGVFTGRKLSHYLSSENVDFVNARRVVNGLDKAELIKDYALKFVTNIQKHYKT